MQLIRKRMSTWGESGSARNAIDIPDLALVRNNFHENSKQKKASAEWKCRKSIDIYREGTDGRQREILDGRTELVDRCWDGRRSVVERLDLHVNLPFDFVLAFTVGTRVEIAWKGRQVRFKVEECLKVQLTFLWRSILVPRVHRRLYRVLVFVDFRRGRWHCVSSNWRCGKSWRRESRMRWHLCHVRLQRSPRNRRQRVVFLFPAKKRKCRVEID